MKKTILLLFTVALFSFYGQAAYGCSCIPVKSDKKVNYKRWLKGFNGSVFIGQVVKIERIESNNQLKVTFEVERYWKGIETAEAIVYTAVDSAACGVPYVEGKKYFVVAKRSESKLSTDLCSWLDYSKNEKRYLKGLGKGKSPGIKSMGGVPETKPTTYSTGAEIACFSSRTWMLFGNSSRRVSSGVGRLLVVLNSEFV